MKKNNPLYILIFLFPHFFNNSALCLFAEQSPCPEGDIILDSQEDVDVFIDTFSCDTIYGDLRIDGFIDISGLSFLTHISGRLSINRIGSLFGLDSLKSIGNSLSVYGNSNLENISGLNNLEFIGGGLFISGCDRLINLSGLNSLNTVGGQLSIQNNNLLNSISDLKNLKTIGGDLKIIHNRKLLSLEGIDNIESVKRIYIERNRILSDCSNICPLINSDSFSGLFVERNATGCRTGIELLTICDESECFEGDITLYSQAEIDAFANSYSSCDTIFGNIKIGERIQNIDLSKLSFISHINGDFSISSSYGLVSLKGLENLQSIKGNLLITGNKRIKDLNTLSNLTFIGKSCFISSNDSLTTLNGLEKIQHIGGYMNIFRNSLLNDCNVLCQMLSENIITEDSIRIGENNFDCDSKNKVISTCTYGNEPIVLNVNGLPNSIEEDDTLRFTVTINSPLPDTLEITITSSEPSIIPLTSYNILPNDTSIIVELILIDDLIPELSKEISITIDAPFLESVNETFILTDENDLPNFELIIQQDTISESGGEFATFGIIRRNSNPNSTLDVVLSTDDAQVYIPSKLTFYKNEEEKQFVIGVEDDSQVNLPKEVIIKASAYLPSCGCNINSGNIGVSESKIVILDNDSPALTLTINPFTLREGSQYATNLMLQRNDLIDTELEVKLSSSDESEITVLSSITMPSGVQSMPIPLQTIFDNIEDGNQEVIVKANANGFSTGTTWVIVSDINKPDLQVINASIPEDTVFPNEEYPIKVLVTNQGVSAAPAIIPLRAYFSKDNRIDESDIILRDYIIDSPIAINDTIEIFDLITFPFPTDEHRLIFEINPNRSLPELLYINNSASPISLKVMPDYSGTSNVVKEVFRRDEKVLVSGKSIKHDGNPMPNGQLEVAVFNEQIEIRKLITTDKNGDYDILFEIPITESGHFYVGAAYPNQESTIKQDEFDVLGLRINDDNFIIWDVILRDTFKGIITVENLTNIDLDNLTVEHYDLPQGMAVNFTLNPILQRNETTELKYEIYSDELSSLEDDYEPIIFSINSNNTTIEEFTAYYFCQNQTAYLRSEVNSIKTKVSKSKSNFIEFNLFNDGLGETGAISIDIPEVDWINLITPSTINSIHTGDTSKIIIEFLPSESLPLNTPAKGNIVLNAQNGNTLDIPFNLEKVSKETGNVIIDIVDPYTYHTEEQPHVSNALVTISHYFTGEILAKGVTNSQGLFYANDLSEGTFRITVQAEKHDSHDGLIEIIPATTIKETIFINYQAISFSWNVVPTTITDEYKIELLLEFETNVPVPVVVIDLPENLPQLSKGETYSFFATVTNNGLITAKDFEIAFQKDPEYEFLTNLKLVDLEPNESIQIPFTMKRKENTLGSNLNKNDWWNITLASSSFAENLLNSIENYPTCLFVALGAYQYICGGHDVFATTAKATSILSRVCPNNGGGSSSGNTSLGSKPNKLGVADIGAKYELYNVNNYTIDDLCDDCINGFVKSILTCGSVYDSAQGTGKYIGAKGCANSLKEGSLYSIVNCGAYTLSNYLGATTKYIDKKFFRLGCFKNIIETVVICYNQFPSASSLSSDNQRSFIGNSVSSFSSASSLSSDNQGGFIDNSISNMRQAIQIFNAEELILEMYFDELAANENISELARVLDYYVLNQTQINEQAQDSILSELSRFDIPLNEVMNSILKWNNTLQAWDQGIFTPNSTFPNIINKIGLENNFDILVDADEFAKKEGFISYAEMIYSNVEELINYHNNAENENSVCASVGISISQDISMTREAFEGILKVYNGHQSDSLKNLSLNLEIYNGIGELSNHLFEIEINELVGISGINGGGSLAPEEEGFAKIIFIPEIDAAPQLSANYSFGGTISYFDPNTKTEVIIPLIPITLEVNPIPDLTLQYFVEKNIIGDDPLTEAIEPVIPSEMAIMIENNGYGEAKNVVIESAQPRIIENEKGLAVNFNLIAADLNGSPTNMGLNLIQFGDIKGKSSKIGQWYFTSDLLGQFTSFNTNLVHSNSRGNPELSLVSGIETHELVKSISVYNDLNDEVDDFLVNDISDKEDTPDAIYLSQGNVVFDVHLAKSVNITGQVIPSNKTSSIEIEPIRLGWNYYKMKDPSDGDFKVTNVTRDDGLKIPLKNIWQSHVSFSSSGNPVYENELHFIDYFSNKNTQQYTLEWELNKMDTLSVTKIEGLSNGVITDRVETLKVIFNKEINSTTFSKEDLILTLNGGNNLINETSEVKQLTPNSFEINISNQTNQNGIYSFTVQEDEIKDLIGLEGKLNSEFAVTWNQFLSIPIVEKIINIPQNHISNSFQELYLKFNLPIDSTTINSSQFSLRKDGISFSSDLKIAPKDSESKVFQLSGLSNTITVDGVYELIINMPKISTVEGVKGIDLQIIELILDTQNPKVIEIKPISLNSLDNHHYNQIEVYFNEKITSFEAEAVEHYFNEELINFPELRINKINDFNYRIEGYDLLTYPEGNYKFVINLQKIKDYAGNSGLEKESFTWKVNRSASINISEVRITPDLGLSNSDFITSQKDLELSFSLNERAKKLSVFQKDDRGFKLLHQQFDTNSGFFSANIKLKDGGQTTVRIELVDFDDNEVSLDVPIFIDELALNGSWLVQGNQFKPENPDTFIFEFSNQIADFEASIEDIVSLTFNNNIVDIPDLAIEKISESKLRIFGLGNLSTLSGIYKIGINLSNFTKILSGVKGNGVVYTSWEIENSNRQPIADAGRDTILNSLLSTFSFDGSSSFDFDGDELTYKWYPPNSIFLSNEKSVFPSVNLSQLDNDISYSFLLKVSDGLSYGSDVINIKKKKGENNFATLSGYIKDSNQFPISGVEIKINDITVFSDLEGMYKEKLSLGKNYIINPIQKEASNENITSQDYRAIVLHVLKLKKIKSPYKLIAADIDNSGKITFKDAFIVRGIAKGKIVEFPNDVPYWRFIPQNFNFIDTSNPFIKPIPESINIDNLSGLIDNLNFVAVRMGDVR